MNYFYQLYGLACICLFVRLTFDRSFGNGNLNQFLVVMECMHHLGEGEPFFFPFLFLFLSLSNLSLRVLSSEKREYLLLCNYSKSGSWWFMGQSTQIFLLFGWPDH